MDPQASPAATPPPEHPDDASVATGPAGDLPTAEQPDIDWPQLRAEQFQLLRLPALTTDRETGPRPLRFARLGRAEHHSRRHSSLLLCIELPGQRLHGDSNRLEIRVDHLRRELHCAGERGLHCEPANRGLGRFLLAQAAAWAAPRWGHYRVRAMALGARGVDTDAARLRRDHALRAQGFELEFEDLLQLVGHCRAETVASLSREWNSERVQPLDLLDGAAMLQQADQSLQQQSVQISGLQQQLETLKREDNGLRFTIVCLIALTLFQAGLLIWIATR